MNKIRKKTLNRRHVLILCLGMSISVCAGQSGDINSRVDFRASTVNQPGRAYPQVNSEGRVRVRISAPRAHMVQLDIGGVKYDLCRDEEGVWTGESAPQDEGFHYYQLNIDGASVPDPGTRYFYGAGRWGSGIEIPASDQAFYALKDVPHGLISENLYFSDITQKWRRCYVYTPPGYEKDNAVRYPVLYLQHGSFEDESSWPQQGNAGLIMDNLIAEKKAEPMIVVMDNGYAYKPESMAAAKDGRRPVSAFEDVMIEEIIPMIDARFRTISDRDHRAIAGLSMGANQTMRILMNNLDTFSSYGGFSGTSNYPSSDPIDVETFLDGKFIDGKALGKQIHVFWLGLGTKEPDPFPGSVGAFRDMLDNIGLDHVYYESPGTAHEWLTWRRSLREFASLIFKHSKH